jgi:glycosyltransferase involved in cell wall biosynthesis
VVAAIGKLSKGRGFELVLQTLAALRKQIGNARLMIIGHGEHRPALEKLARELGIDGAVTWAGYHEDDLADHYRAADFLLFTAKGSDEGHRAVIEAMACATVPITVPLPGMEALLQDLSASLIVAEPTAQSLASCILTHIDDLDLLRPRVVTRARDFNYPHAASRLIAAYSRIL